MTANLPNYANVNPPDGTSPEEYSTHDRRAEVMQVIVERGSPFAINQYRLAERYDVNQSTISRDIDRIRESIDEHLGDDATLLTRTLLETTVRRLQAEGEWKAAWDVVMDWNDWLADLGEQHREPRRSSVDVEMESRHAEVAYTVVREGDDEPLPAPETRDTPVAEDGASADVGAASDEQSEDTGGTDAGDDGDASADEHGRVADAALGFTSTPVSVELEGDAEDETDGEAGGR